MTNQNTVQATFTAFAKEVARHGKATTKLVDELRANGVSPADIKGAGKNAGEHVASFMNGVAQATLSAAQFETWSNGELATKVKGELTERGKLMGRVSSRASKVRAAFEREIKAQDKANGAAGESESESKGAGASKRSPAEVDLEKLLQVQARLSAAIKQDKADDYGQNPEAILMALDSAIKAFKK